MVEIFDTNIIKNLIEEDLLACINAIGRIKYERGYELYVDKKQNPNYFILKSDGWLTGYSKVEFEEELIEKLINQQELDFCGILERYYKKIKSKKNIVWEEHCWLYYMPKKEIDKSMIKHKVESLKLEDAEEVNKYYTYKSEESLEYIKDCIKNRDTSAIYKEDGELVSWAVVREDGSMGIMYTKEEYRKQGLALSISLDLANKVLKNGDVPYVHIEESNKASMALAKTLGFVRDKRVVWFEIK